MSIASDLKSWGATSFRISVTSVSSTIDTLTSGTIIGTRASHLVVVPTTSDVYFNVGAAASASTFKIPKSGAVFNCDVNFLNNLQFYSANTTDVDLFIGSQAARMFLQDSGIIDGYNPSLAALDVNEIAPAITQFTKITGIAQLTAPGSTAGVTVNGMGVYGYTFTVAAIGTNVIVGLTGTIDGTNYAELPLDNTAVATAAITLNRMTITANGTYTIYSSAPVDEARFTWVSESTGTPTIDVDFFGRRK